jgi:hypothetical protein
MQTGQTTILGAGLLSAGATSKASYIMYQNLMSDATVTAGGDVGRLHDWMTNIKYTAAAGTHNIDLTLDQSEAVNCVALAGVNWLSGGVTAKFFTWNGSAYVLQCDLFGAYDDTPVMRIIPLTYTDRVRIQFVSTSTLYAGEAAFGEALQMPSCPSVGLQPAEWSDDDDYSLSVTQSRNIGPSTIERKGSTQQMEFKYITPDFVDGPINNMRRVAKGRPVWVGWNQKDRPASVIFGNMTMQPPKFDSSTFTSLSFTIKGVA